MKTFVIATEAGIKIEVKENLKKNQVNKLENNFSEVKNFVEDKGGGSVVITVQEKHIILGIMLQQVVSPDAIDAISKDTEMLMEDTIKFINHLPDEEQKQEVEEYTEKIHNALEKAFEDLNTQFPNNPICIVTVNGNEACLMGNMDKVFASMVLLDSAFKHDEHDKSENG